MFLKRRVGGDFKVREKVARIARLVVVGTQHFGCHRLPETTAARDATETALCEKRAVYNGNQPRLVNVFTVPYSLESSIADIDVCSHDVFDFGAKVEIF